MVSELVEHYHSQLGASLSYDCILYSNCSEALLVCELVEYYYTQLGVSQQDIGVITPYWAQAATIRSSGGDHYIVN